MGRDRLHQNPQKVDPDCAVSRGTKGLFVVMIGFRPTHPSAEGCVGLGHTLCEKTDRKEYKPVQLVPGSIFSAFFVSFVCFVVAPHHTHAKSPYTRANPLEKEYYHHDRGPF